MNSISKSLLSAAAIAAVAVVTTGCTVPEDTNSKGTYASQRNHKPDTTPATEKKSKAAPTVEKTPKSAPTVKQQDQAPAETAAQENARRSAGDYLDYSAFSRSGLIDQLKFEGYSVNDATYGADAVHANWKQQAAASAKDYLDYSSFSRSGLIDQLKFEGYSQAQATYGVNKAGL